MARNNNNNNTASEATAATKNMHAEGTVVYATIEVRKERGGKAYTFEVAIDFKGVSDQQILLWAARTKIIDLQRAIRACDEPFIANLAKQGVLKRDAVEAGSGFVPTSKMKERITTQFKGLTPEARAELLAMLQSM